MSLTSQQGVERILEVCIDLQAGERLGLLVDEADRLPIADALSVAAEQRGASCQVITLDDAHLSPDLPEEEIPDGILDHDVLVGLTSRSLYHATIGRTAADQQRRVLALTQVDYSMLESEALAADFLALEPYADGLAELLGQASTISVTSPAGTDLVASLDGRDGYACTGLARRPGVRNGCPDIEGYIAPVEDSMTGVAVFDGSSTPFGLIEEPIQIEFERGIARSITGGKDARELEEYLDSLGPEMRTAAEFGFGLNPNCRVVGRIVEDEGTYGTGHIALGSNEAFGGVSRAPAHVDLVYWTPTMRLDGEVIFQDGHLKSDSSFAAQYQPVRPH